MSDVINKAVAKLNEKLSAQDLGGTAKFVINGEGSILIDGDGAREGDGPADVTLTADRDTFEGILDGSENPTAAFMSGRLAVDGDMGTAMKMAAAL